jgi:hypothetical protein
MQPRCAGAPRAIWPASAVRRCLQPASRSAHQSAVPYYRPFSLLSALSQGLSYPSASLGEDWRAVRAKLVAWEQREQRAADAAVQLKRPTYPQFVAGRASLLNASLHSLGPSGPLALGGLRNRNSTLLSAGNSWAHPLLEPEQGCLLLARHEHMSFFSGAVILVTSHEDSVGSVGYVLNKTSPLRVEELQVLGAASGRRHGLTRHEHNQPRRGPGASHMRMHALKLMRHTAQRALRRLQGGVRE